MILSPEIENLAEWLEKEKLKNKYCDLSVTVKVHDGEVKFTELNKTIKNKYQKNE